MKKIISIILLLWFWMGLYPSIVSASVLDDLTEYRTSISQTTSDEVADKITRRYLNYWLTPISWANWNSWSTSNNFFKSSNWNIKIVSSSIWFWWSVHWRNTEVLVF